jgi:hypothetical protein
MSVSGDEVDIRTQLDTSSVSAEEFQESDKDDKHEKSVSPHKKKEKHSTSNPSHSIPSDIESQITSLPEVQYYIAKLLHKLHSYEKDIKKLKRKAKKVSHKVILIQVKCAHTMYIHRYII